MIRSTILICLLGLLVCSFCADAFAGTGLRNPFALPQGVQLRQGKDARQKAPEPIPDLVLNAVVMGERQSIASINHRNFVLGDSVLDGWRLTEIAPKHVVLKNAKRRITLKLNRPPFRIGVRTGY